MFCAVDFKEGRIGIYDDNDGKVEYWRPSDLKKVIKNFGISIDGVTLSEDMNPMYTLDGLEVNLFYRNSIENGKFRAVLLNKGEYWGITFSSRIDKPTVAFFDVDTSFDKHKYPSGQYIASYYVDTILGHTGDLALNTEVPAWRIDAKSIEHIKSWLRGKLNS